MSAKPAVCLLDDDADFRASIKLLCRSRNIPFLGFATPGEFYEGYTEKHVGCVILDLKMPGASGLDVLREMRAKNILLPVILLTGHATVDIAVEAMKAGATDVVEKPFKDSVLIEKVQAAFAKADQCRKLAAERQLVEPKMSSLTPREHQVLDLMVAGYRNPKIAADLGISPKTLDIHRANIMRKMQTKTIADMVRWRIVSGTDAMGVAPVFQRV